MTQNKELGVYAPLDHTPETGLTNSHIRFAGFDVIKGGARLRFELLGDDNSVMGTIPIEVGPQAEETVDAMIAEGYRILNDILRQWIAEAATHYRAYASRGSEPTGT